MPEHWVQIRKEINYITPSHIKASFETHPPQLHNLL